MPGLVPGLVLRDRYRLESVLGRGVMGQVWQGRDLPFDRPVAVKTVATELLAMASSRDAARLLEKKPEDRPASAAEVAALLAAWAPGPAPVAGAAPAQPRSMPCAVPAAPPAPWGSTRT
jgi:hypothetical protein